ncbi:hypothetical protein [Halalkalibacterium halodurans]|uniref:BH1616 protein n=2 Tax=Halalkalibacterium halodurans TaxID=86665 RepID=Q9KCF5_HALH5|nr:hypothetical protein [Halalkalibacterium halodurans]MDY7222188.1 hypothetical protein [Halalkalibacterium halodurans]MDY7241409.1 hypothetical protein [Halalkalibacterium halodurans]MED4124592.1 hypothetical protein [Halalkalibacterium halodurans]MED4173056.1 hypothetical protein [Halalkalibacterium halodurans]TPE70542.1 hypothetical protein AMD02_002950 [Halalkalibacterium halodurans]
MSENQLDRAMERLKRQYDEMPTRSSSAKIAANIKKKRQWPARFQRWQMAALLVLTVGIGSVLGLNLFGNPSQPEEFSLHADSEQERAIEKGSLEQDEHQTNMDQGAEAGALEADEEPVETPAMEEEGEETSPANDAEQPDIGMAEADEADVETRIVYGELEGMSEEFVYKKEVIDEFGLDFWYDERFVLERFNENGIVGRQVYVKFSGGDPIWDVPVFELFAFTNDATFEAYVDVLETEGYTKSGTDDLITSQTRLQAIDDEYDVFRNDDVEVHLARFEHHQGGEFAIRLNRPTEYVEWSEGYGPHEQLMLENIEHRYDERN